MFEFIDHIIYINLPESTDRREMIEKELSKFPPEKVTRFNAFRMNPGSIGCTRSHIGALELAISKGYRNVLIVEDDMVWNPEFEKQYPILEEKVSQPYDVIVMAGTYVRYDKKTLKLQKCNCTGAYLVNQNYYFTLLNNFKQGYHILYRHSNTFLKLVRDSRADMKECHYNADTYWRHLQARDNWFIVQMMYNRPCFSLIQQHVVDWTPYFDLEYMYKNNDSTTQTIS
jgi:glycosyl transferase family 25